VTSNREQPPRPSRPRRPRQDASSSGPPPQRADEGDLWADREEPSAPAADEAVSDGIDDFVADLPPPYEEPPPAPTSARRRAAAPPPAYEAYEEDFDYDEAEYSMLRNPYVLAALAVAGAIILAVAFVIMFSEGEDNPSGVVVTESSPTPLPGELPGVQARGLAKAAIREGPGLEFFELGLLNKDQEVSVVGRNDDSSWYQIVFAGRLTGWVPRSALKLPDDADEAIEVVVFTPIPKPSVEQPTATPEVTPTEDAAATPPDISLEVLGNVCPASGDLNVALRNVGDVDIEGREITVTISTPGEVLSEQTLELTLGVGQLVPINIGMEVQPPRTMVAVVFAGEPQDLDPSNNVVTCVVGPGQDEE
jgi:hypothetical protein